MAAARAANAPQLTLHDDPPAPDIPTVIHAPGPPAAPWRAVRAPRRPIARWLGIGSCALLFGLLAVTVLTPPISSEIERLIRPWLEWQQDRKAATPQTDSTLPTLPEPAAGRDAAPSGSVPLVARKGLGAAGEPGEVAAPGNADPTARSVPVPSFKPALANQ